MAVAMLRCVKSSLTHFRDFILTEDVTFYKGQSCGASADNLSLCDQYLEELPTSEERHFLCKAKETRPVGLTDSQLKAGVTVSAGIWLISRTR